MIKLYFIDKEYTFDNLKELSKFVNKLYKKEKESILKKSRKGVANMFKSIGDIIEPKEKVHKAIPVIEEEEKEEPLVEGQVISS